jgi:hypothetical protein
MYLIKDINMVNNRAFQGKNVMVSKNTKGVSGGDDFEAVAGTGTRVNIQIGAIQIQIDSSVPVQISIAANENAPVPPAVTTVAPAPVLAETRLLAVGDELKDGTICIAVDDRKGEALVVPAGFFAGKSRHFAKDQDSLVAQFNAWAARAEQAQNKEQAALAADGKKQAHGHDDWRRLTDAEASLLARVWLKVARGRLPEDYWMSSSFGNPESLQGQVRRGGEGVPIWITNRDKDLWVPVVRAVNAVQTF